MGDAGLDRFLSERRTRLGTGAQRAIREAQEYAREIVQEARREAYKIASEAGSEKEVVVRELEEKIFVLKRERGELKRQLRLLQMNVNNAKASAKRIEETAVAKANAKAEKILDKAHRRAQKKLEDVQEAIGSASLSKILAHARAARREADRALVKSYQPTEVTPEERLRLVTDEASKYGKLKGKAA